MPALGFFYGLEGNKLYKVYVTEGALCGAKVASNIYDEATARATTVHFGLLGLLLSRKIARDTLRKRAEKEALYDATEPGGPTFMTTDKANFSLGSAGITRIVVNEKKSGLKALLNGGAGVEVHTAEGKKRRFVLIGDQNPGYVKNLIARSYSTVELAEAS